MSLCKRKEDIEYICTITRYVSNIVTMKNRNLIHKENNFYLIQHIDKAIYLAPNNNAATIHYNDMVFTLTSRENSNFFGLKKKVMSFKEKKLNLPLVKERFFLIEISYT